VGGASLERGSKGPPAATANGVVCPDFHAAVELIGRRWAGAILFSLIDGPRYFGELAATIPGISDRLLSQRLRELEAEGVVQRSVHPGPPARVSYCLTEVGEGLEPALRELYDWAHERRSNGASSAGD
jgi:DNA-binding HxlR family transcriptional regulator